MGTIKDLASMAVAFTYVMGVKVLWLPVWAVQRGVERLRGKR
jgi:hypothetical protein